MYLFSYVFYSDGVELVNPLGAGRGKHKVIQIFLTFGEIPKYQRSKIDRIQLVAVLKEKLVKQFGFQRVYQRIVEDLIHLEKGINISYPVERVIKCGLLLHPADNLEGKKILDYIGLDKGMNKQTFGQRNIMGPKKFWVPKVAQRIVGFEKTREADISNNYYQNNKLYVLLNKYAHRILGFQSYKVNTTTILNYFSKTIETYIDYI